MFQCVDKPTRCNTSYKRSLLSTNWLHMFRTITSPSSHKLYNALVCSCYQASLAVALQQLGGLSEYRKMEARWSEWCDPKGGFLFEGVETTARRPAILTEVSSWFLSVPPDNSNLFRSALFHILPNSLFTDHPNIQRCVYIIYIYML